MEASAINLVEDKMHAVSTVARKGSLERTGIRLSIDRKTQAPRYTNTLPERAEWVAP